MLEMHDSLAAPVLLIFSFEIEALNSPHASELLTQTSEKEKESILLRDRSINKAAPAIFEGTNAP